MSGNSYKAYKEKKQRTLSATSVEELLGEIEEREKMANPFPLDVFHPNIKPFIELIHEHYDIPRSFIGLSMLTAYSTAIGNGYYLSNKKLGAMPLTVWAALVGMSSSGKSVIMKQIFDPLNEIQKDFSAEWKANGEMLGDEERKNYPLRKLIFNDIQIPTLVRWVLPDNLKGMLKFSDEILEWINGMNPNNRSEGNEEQFWLKCWDGGSHQITRSGKQETFIDKMFINNFGSIQPTVLHKLFKNDRATTGFIFRFLFAIPEENKIAIPSLDFDMPEQLQELHRRSINTLYKALWVNDLDDVRKCIFSPQAIRTFDVWRKEKAHKINGMESLYEKNLQGGIYGKITAYTQRLAAILHVSDKAYNHETFQQEEIIEEETIERAIKLGDYFFASAYETHNLAKEHENAPLDVARIAILWSSGKSYTQIAESEYQNLTPSAGKKKVERMVKKNLPMYPRLFRAETGKI